MMKFMTHIGGPAVVGLAVLVGAAVAMAESPPPRSVGPEGKGARQASSPSTSDFQLLVVGNNSDNIVRFDLSSGQATVVSKLATGCRPWSIAANPAGEMFVGLHGNKKNIVRLVPGKTGAKDGPLVAVDLTGTIGRFGPGLMAFDRRGLLNVAGDTNRAVLRYDVETGRLVESMRLRAANLVGLTLNGNYLYAAEYFQQTILRFDLSADPATGEKFICKSEHLNRAHGMTIGHNGHLFVSNLQNSLVQEFSSGTGEFIKTFLDVRTIGGGRVKDLHFEPRLDHYLLSSGDAVYELSTDGALLAKYQSDTLAGAVAIAITPAVKEVVRADANLRLRVYQGVPLVQAAGTNKLVSDRIVSIGKPFEFKGEFSLVVSGLVSRDEEGNLHFKGRLRNNAGLNEFDSPAKLGEGIQSQGGFASGGFFAYFVQLDVPQ